jgi:hypothetical protein
MGVVTQPLANKHHPERYNPRAAAGPVRCRCFSGRYSFLGGCPVFTPYKLVDTDDDFAVSWSS